MSGTVQIGRLRKAYIDPAGVGQGTYAELTKAGAVTVPHERSQIKVPERGYDHVRYALGQADSVIKVQLTRRPGDTQYEAMRSAYINGTGIGFAIADGPIATSGSKGWHADCLVASFPEDDADLETAQFEVTLVPDADGAQEPEFFTVA